MGSVRFINHASVLLTQGARCLLTDPWYSGSAFNDGWRLLQETAEADVLALLDETTDIWLSHEHPDHFRPDFFRRHRDLMRARGITVHFQLTRDKRVAGFLRGLGLTVNEMPEGRPTQLAPDFTIRTIKADFYDSALLCEMGGTKVFNLNDCHFGEAPALNRIVRAHGTCDVLLTQFSYAAWKGGPENIAWRQAAAAEKLRGIRNQIAALRPRAVIPFASFVRFANEENAYLNDAVNRPADILAADPPMGAPVVVLRPGEEQDLSALRQAPESLDHWAAVYARLPDMPLLRYERPVALPDLAAGFAAYRARMFAQNAGWLIRTIAALRLMGAFQPVRVALTDAPGTTVAVDLARGRFAAEGGTADVAMHSQSLAFLFAHDFGFDTLGANGCFREARAGGFLRMAKSLALGNLNAMGMRLSPALAFDAAFVAIFLEKLSRIRDRLARPA